MEVIIIDNIGKLHNKKVKLKANEILARAKRTGYYTPVYTNFVKDNKDTTFTAVLEEGYTEMYTFKEDGVWLFHEDDLLKVE